MAGYNKYVRETDPATFPTECRNGPWVKQIDEIDLLSYYRIVAGFASGEQFASGAVFAAVPPGVDPTPVPVAPAVVSNKSLKVIARPRSSPRPTPPQRKTSATSASPAMPGASAPTSRRTAAACCSPTRISRTPARDVSTKCRSRCRATSTSTARGLIGTPIPLLGFNRNLGWSHTVSTSRRYTMYELTLKAG